MDSKDEVRPTPPHRNPSISHLSQVLRATREGKMTVEELAAASGVSIGLISQLERGIGNPSFNTLMRLSRALGLHIATLFQDSGYDPSELIVRKEARRKLISEGVQQELLSPDTRQKFDVVWTTIAPGYTNADTPMSHEGAKTYLVVLGKMEVILDGTAHQLNDGDTISFDSSVPHSFANKTDDEAAFIGVSTLSASQRRY